MGRLDSILPQPHDITLDMMVTEAALQIAHATGK
jgi:5-formyltetrahydrofolate cyclo-ligase